MKHALSPWRLYDYEIFRSSSLTKPRILQGSSFGPASRPQPPPVWNRHALAPNPSSTVRRPFGGRGWQLCARHIPDLLPRPSAQRRCTQHCGRLPAKSAKAPDSAPRHQRLGGSKCFHISLLPKTCQPKTPRAGLDQHRHRQGNRSRYLAALRIKAPPLRFVKPQGWLGSNHLLRGDGPTGLLATKTVRALSYLQIATARRLPGQTERMQQVPITSGTA